MSFVHGSRDTVAQDSVTQIARDVADRIMNIQHGWKNNDSALYVLLRKLTKKRTVTNYKFECYEEVDRPNSGTVNGTVAKNATTIVFDSTFGAQIYADMMIIVPATNERIILRTVNTSTYTATNCVRNAGAAIAGTDGTTEGLGIQITSGWEVRCAGHSHPEGSTSPEATSTLPEASYNYIQVFKTTAAITTEATKMKLYGEVNSLDKRTKDAGDKHKRDINSALWFGARAMRTHPTTGKREWNTGGIIQHLKANSTNVSGGTITMKVFDQHLEKVMENNVGGTIYMFGGLRMASCLDNLPRAVLTSMDKSIESFGTNMKELVTNKGKIRFVLDQKVFTGGYANLAPTLCLEDDSIGIAVLEGLDTMLKTNVQDDSDSEFKNVWETRLGLYMYGYGLDHTMATTTGENRSRHGYLYTTETDFTY